MTHPAPPQGPPVGWRLRPVATELALGALAVVVVGLPSLALPFGVDQGQQAAIGKLIAEGRILYRDIWDNRSPGVYHLAALAWRLGLDGMSGLRIFDLVWQVATALVLGALASRLSPRRGAPFLAAFLYGATYYGLGDFAHTCQPDGKLGLLIGLGCWLLLVARRRPLPWGSLAASGALLGAAFLIKYPALLGLLPLGIAAASSDRRRLLRSAGLAALGFVGVVGAYVGNLWAPESLEAFFLDTVHFNAGYRAIGAEVPGASAALREAVALLLRHREVVAPLLLLPLARPLRAAVPLAWLAAGLGMFVVQGKFYAMHLDPALPPLALLSALALAGLGGRLAEAGASLRQRAVWAAILGLSLAAGYRTAVAWSEFAAAGAAAARGPEATRRFQRRFVGIPPGYSVPDVVEVADWLRAHKRRDDYLFVWGFLPGLYFLADLEPSSRFVSHLPLAARFGWPGHRDQLAHDLRARPPRYLVIQRGDRQPWTLGHARTSEELLDEFALVRDLRARGELVLENDTLRLYRID